MRSFKPLVTLSEIPGEVCLTFPVTGCPMRCRNCHSPELRDSLQGSDLTREKYLDLLRDHSGLVSCILFLGGDWLPEELAERLDEAKSRGFLTGLYSGNPYVKNEKILSNLDFLKTGPFVQFPINDPRTNQRLVDFRTGEDITYRFWKH